MSCMRKLIAAVVLLPLAAASLPAQAAKMDVKAARAECFRQAHEAANAAGFNMGSGAIGAAQSIGADTYRSCCYKMGIRP
jgi:hypothetical protein